MMKVIYQNGNAVVTGLKQFDAGQMLDCGQAFRWEYQNGCWHGVALGLPVTLRETDDGFILMNTDRKTFESVWFDYFDLGRDYGEVIEAVSGNDILRKAAGFSSGIRILRQDPWEVLCSFIISQNNNIPRIKGIIDRMCRTFGTMKNGDYTFPQPGVLAALDEQSLAPLRSGFRAKYILDAARRVEDGRLDLKKIEALPYGDAKEQLMTVRGVGPKVADCVLLFGYGRLEAFPKDVWIKRVLQVLFDGTLPEVAAPFAGIVQQYLFYYARKTHLSSVQTVHSQK